MLKALTMIAGVAALAACAPQHDHRHHGHKHDGKAWHKEYNCCCDKSGKATYCAEHHRGEKKECHGKKDKRWGKHDHKHGYDRKTSHWKHHHADHNSHAHGHDHGAWGYDHGERTYDPVPTGLKSQYTIDDHPRRR